VPDEETSFEVVYAVVEAPSVADEVYSAILKTSAAVEARITPVPKLWIPSRISTLKLVVIAWLIAISIS
jgi:hypothetical protein